MLNFSFPNFVSSSNDNGVFVLNWNFLSLTFILCIPVCILIPELQKYSPIKFDSLDFSNQHFHTLQTPPTNWFQSFLNHIVHYSLGNEPSSLVLKSVLITISSLVQNNWHQKFKGKEVYFGSQWQSIPSQFQLLTHSNTETVQEKGQKTEYCSHHDQIDIIHEIIFFFHIDLTVLYCLVCFLIWRKISLLMRRMCFHVLHYCR